MAVSIKLVSINIERSLHLGTVVPFLTQSKAEVICIQELCERDIDRVKAELGMDCIFAPSGCHPADVVDEPSQVVGIAIFSLRPLSRVSTTYYDGSEEMARNAPEHRIFTDTALAAVDIEKDGAIFRIATTHFTWTPNGLPNDAQYRTIEALLNLLSNEREFVLTGDFNAPRGGEIFSKLAAVYRDNIPTQYLTSIDANLHRNGKVNAHELADKMVDGLFTTPEYMVSDVVLIPGISDHYAITATITRS